ncbi:MAG: DNA cytosine methyltransferase [Bacteroidales bacterium]|nr:DNA cytosine methyltransferase [Bacteroidales bacterium]
MKIVSLFAGCGGLDLGFERAGFSVIWANEFDTTIHETYIKNHPNTILNTKDIRSLKEEDIPECDGIIGGPPCQSWSEGGKQLGINDPRGQLFWEYIRIVSIKKPKFFIIENVQGILEEKHKNSLQHFTQSLISCGYRLSYELLNAADYKIPQDRYRVFFIGIRKDLKYTFSFPDSVTSTPITLKQAIGDITETPRFYNDDIVDSDNTIRPNHDVYMGCYDDKYMARNRVRSWDEPSFTIQAQARNVPQHPQAPKMSYISQDKRVFAKGYEHLYRRLSVRECARIQTFPDSFRFYYKDVKDGYKMVGNAVPPRLAWYLALQIQKAFINEKEPITKRIPVKHFMQGHSSVLLKNGAISTFNTSKNALICLVTKANSHSFLEKTAKLYYTGKLFPASIDIDNLYYFMPYIKGKGIRDLYYIKIVRIGSKQEVHPDCDKNDVRIIFEIEYIKQIFDDYIPIHLNYWRTYSSYLLKNILNIGEQEDTD